MKGTDGATFPFWSPDGRQIGFFAGGKLMKISTSGGAAFTICEASDGRGGSWTREDVILFAPSTAIGLFRVSAAGGVPQPVTSIDPKSHETTHRLPWFLPDGNHFLYTAGGDEAGPGEAVNAVYLASLRDPSHRTKVAEGRTNAQVAQNHILYLRNQFLMAQPYDPTTLALAGEPFPVAESVQQVSSIWAGTFSVSGNGLLAYSRGAGGSTALVETDDGGNVLRELAPAGQYGRVRLSPDGKRLAATVIDQATGESDIWILDLEHGSRIRLTFDKKDSDSVWSPDGARIAFRSGRSGRGDIYIKPSSGSGSDELVYQSPGYDDPEDWSPDGKTIIFTRQNEQGLGELWRLDLSTREATTILAVKGFETGWGHLSPDGNWLAYLSNESGRWEAYVIRLQGSGGSRWQVTTSGAQWMLGWKNDGSEIYVLDAVHVTRIPVRATTDTLETGKPEQLVQCDTFDSFDRFPDGRSFVVARLPEGGERKVITLVVDWLARRDGK